MEIIAIARIWTVSFYIFWQKKNLLDVFALIDNNN